MTSTPIPPHTDPWWERRRREELGLTVRLGWAWKDYEDEEFLLTAKPLGRSSPRTRLKAETWRVAEERR